MEDRRRVHIFVNRRVGTVTRVRRPFSNVIVLTIQTINGPEDNGHKSRRKVARAATELLGVELVTVHRAARLTRAELNKARRFKRTLANNPAPALRGKSNHKFSRLHVTHGQRRVRPARHDERVVINRHLTLHTNARQLIGVGAQVPGQVPRFINGLVRLPIDRYIELVGSRRIGVKAQSRLTTNRQARHTGAGTKLQGIGERHLTDLLPRLFRTVRNRVHADLAFHHAVTMRTINVQLACVRRALFGAVGH